MKTAKQAQREARQLLRLCLVDGRLAEARARHVVEALVAAARPGTFPVLTRFQRLVRLDRAKQSAQVTSATPLGADLRALIEASIARRYQQDMVTAFAEDPALLGGVRVTVGSDVYDGSIKAALAALAAQW